MNSDDILAEVRVLESRVDSLTARVNQMEQTCSSCQAMFRGDVAGVYDKIQRLDDRVRSLEIRVAFVAGGAALFGTVAGALLDTLLHIGG